MYNLSTTALQDIAVKCVAQFMNKQASLNEAVATEAKELELNPEQIKRVIETTNTLAYLRQLKDAEDRTFEFPVADYNSVMGKMVIPNESNGTMKVASDFAGNSTTSIGENMEAVDREYNLDAQEKRAMLAKETFKCREVLEKMAEDKAYLKETLLTKAANLKRDELLLEKLAEVVSEEDFPAMCRLCGLEKTAADVIGKSVFIDKDLVDTKEVYDLYKEAKEVVKEEAEMLEFVKRASVVLEFEKEAFLGKVLGWAANKIGTGLGSAVSGTVGYAGSKVGDTISNIGQFSSAASSKGFKNTKEAVKAYDKLKSTKGEIAATTEFKGTKPSHLVHRVGLLNAAGTALSFTQGSSIEHKHNVWDSLND